MSKIVQGKILADGLKFAIVVSRFNDFITEKLLDGAIDTITRSGGSKDNISIIKVPGAFEIPLVANKLAKKGGIDGIICLGAIIRGSTQHHEYISTQLVKGINNVMLNSNIPVGFGIITADNLEQAIERAGAKQGNKGVEATLSVIEMINILKQL